MAQAALEALVENMTLRQLSDQTGRSVSSIVEWAMARKGVAKAPAKTAAAPTPAKRKAGATAKAGAVNVRTPAGRIAYDDAVLATVAEAGRDISAQQVRSKVGGTPAQARAALNRLIDLNKIGYKGKARATKYYVS